MAKASEGLWMWDALTSSAFISRAYISLALGDMLGSAKLNGMAGHSAIYGDRFSLVQAAKSSNHKGSKAQYYPMNHEISSQYNPQRDKYSPLNLPIRTQGGYWDIIRELESKSSGNSKAAVTKATGVVRLPLCAASPAFIHPVFFPLDPFHLFYENCMAYMWDLWTILSPENDPVHLDRITAQTLGEYVVGGMKSLPPAFCGPVRDPF
ncbi:hypothetical protein BD779DRAFT_1464471 [Infundibulicybe gibba]|nr:hypothetical protein BD779DRAFT_1464471 [Infundibulicybe gibba]